MKEKCKFYRPIMLSQILEDVKQTQQYKDNDDGDPPQSPHIRPRL